MLFARVQELFHLQSSPKHTHGSLPQLLQVFAPASPSQETFPDPLFKISHPHPHPSALSLLYSFDIFCVFFLLFFVF
jgi:hypothetical protein